MEITKEQILKIVDQCFHYYASSKRHDAKEKAINLIDKHESEQLIITDVVFSEAELKAKLEEQLEGTRQWLIGEDFEGLAERL